MSGNLTIERAGNATHTEPEDAGHDSQAPQEADDNPGQNQEDSTSGEQSTQPPKHDISILQNPIPFIGEMRKALFEIARPIELKHEEFTRYWPYVDNVWVRQHRAGSTEYYACRLQRATYASKKEQHDSDNPSQRKKRTRQGGTCQARIKISKQDGLVPSYLVQRSGEQGHSHDLDYIDEIKRNSVVMDVSRSEVMKGYMPASVFTVLHEDEAKLASIGGRYLKRIDVRNASQRWRTSYQGELGVHPGYRYEIGSGISAVTDDTPITIEASIQQPAAQQASLQALPADTLFFPSTTSEFLNPYLPSSQQARLSTQLPFVTLTYAASLDSLLALSTSIPTPISGPVSKAMTHHLRANHDAILVGVGTAIADNPTLNCRIAGAGGYGGLGWSSQPRPIIIDPTARWELHHDSKILAAVRSGRGKAPWIVIGPNARPQQQQNDLLLEHGGKYLTLKFSTFDRRWKFSWEDIFRLLSTENIKSVMVEGGSGVIRALFSAENRPLVDSVVITLAPVYLGASIGGGKGDDVSIGVARRTDAAGTAIPALRFTDVKWQPLGEDVVMCGRLAEQMQV